MTRSVDDRGSPTTRKSGRIIDDDGSSTVREDECQTEDGCTYHVSDRSWQCHVSEDASVVAERGWGWLTVG
jgi:hypothetical protein